MDKKRVAVIDLGTNTFNLLIADVCNGMVDVIHTEKDGVAIGMGGLNNGVIVSDAILRGLKTLTHFADMCERHFVDEIKAFGTSALRGAINGLDFVNLIEKETGILVKIISGDDEARLIYEGVKWTYPFDQETMVMDVGGGSTEFILADHFGVKELVSLDIGVSRIFQELTLQDPLSDEDCVTIESWIAEKASSFMDGKKCDTLLGASGCFETFYEMIYKSSYPSMTDTFELPMDKLEAVLDEVILSNRFQRDENPYIIPIRRKMAPIAAIKTRWVIKQLGVSKVIVSPCSLKEGVLQS